VLTGKLAYRKTLSSYDLIAKIRAISVPLASWIQMVNPAVIVGLAVTLIVVGFVLVIGMNIYYTGYSTISNVVLGTTGNATRTALNSAIWGAFNMSTVLPTIIAGSAVIAAIMVGFVFWSSNRQ